MRLDPTITWPPDDRNAEAGTAGERSAERDEEEDLHAPPPIRPRPEPRPRRLPRPQHRHRARSDLTRRRHRRLLQYMLWFVLMAVGALVYAWETTDKPEQPFARWSSAIISIPCSPAQRDPQSPRRCP
jgi:hypothetical protein